MSSARLVVWFPFAVGFLVATQIALGRGPLGEPTWTNEAALFWIVVVAATLCVITSAAVLVAAHRRDLAELGLLGGFLFAASWLPLVHGLTVPGMLYGDNSATMSAAASAVPAAVLSAAPLLLPPGTRRSRILSWWRVWTGGWILAVTAFGTALLVEPELLPAPTMGAVPAVAVGLAAAAASMALALRQLRLAEISRRPGSVAMPAALALVGTSALVWTGERVFNAGFWFAHAVDIVGVFLGCAAGVLAYRVDGSLRRVVQPVLAAEPAAALELGLDPLVHRFVGMLDAKDPLTRDHVVRCAELAMAVAPRLGVRPEEQRDLGVAAILHDVGKLETPPAVLTKPGALDEDETATMRRHAEVGARLVLASPALCGAAPAVRSHHERWDGAGYPDGLAGSSIPVHARIVSVCDALDAMVSDRHYRAGMDTERALGILREHAGTQWDPEVVAAVCAHVEECGLPLTDGALADLGRGDDLAGTVDAAFCGCAEALPASVRS